MKNRDSITVTVRAFIPPPRSEGQYELGKAFTIELSRGVTLGELAQKILARNINQLGLMAVNGVVAKENLILSPGDRIDLYVLIDGG